MQARSGFLYSMLVLVLFLLVLSCAVNPVTGKRELMLLSEADEIQLGKQSDQGVVQTYGVYPDTALTAYITDIGMRMARISHRPQLNYQFKVMDSPIINAFAVPGGYVYFTRGIMAYLNSEAEFAGVLGHEIGHVTARHSAKQYSKAQLTQLAFGLGVALSENFRKYAGLAQFGVGMLFLKFGRDQERQSDQLGVEYSTKIGYDATQMANFFVTLQRMSSSQEGGLPNWFSTHPNPADRVVAVRKAAAEKQAQAGGKPFKVNREKYLRHIDGIVFGEDPRQGFTEGNIFYHPQLKFSFPFPNGWKLINTPTQVQVVSPKEDAVIMFTLGSAASPAAEATRFVSGSGARLVSRRKAKVGGFNAEILESVVARQADTLQVLSYFIQKKQTVFVFHGISSPASFTGHRSAFQNSMGKYRRLTDSSKLNVKPARVRVRQTSRSATLRDALLALGVPQDKLEDTALLNSRYLTDQVPAKTLLKIIDPGR